MTTTNAVARLTKSQKFEAIASYMESMDSEVEVGGIPASVLAEAMRHELELLAKKNAGTGERKPTATQTANMGIKEAMLNAMEHGVAYTASELLKLVPELDGYQVQKATALLRQLTLEGKVVKSEDKRKTYFTLAD